MAIDKFTKRGNKWVIDKDPNAVLDYTIDFTQFLTPDLDTIVSAVALTTGGLVTDSTVVSPMKVVAWLSGGDITQDGAFASLTVRITTANSPARIEDRTVYFNILQR